jgi:hypothetical protein
MFGRDANALCRMGQGPPRPRPARRGHLLAVGLGYPLQELLSEQCKPRRPADAAPVGKLLPRQLVYRCADPFLTRVLVT